MKSKLHNLKVQKQKLIKARKAAIPMLMVYFILSLVLVGFFVDNWGDTVSKLVLVNVVFSMFVCFGIPIYLTNRIRTVRNEIVAIKINERKRYENEILKAQLIEKLNNDKDFENKIKVFTELAGLLIKDNDQDRDEVIKQLEKLTDEPLHFFESGVYNLASDCRNTWDIVANVFTTSMWGKGYVNNFTKHNHYFKLDFEPFIDSVEGMEQAYQYPHNSIGKRDMLWKIYESVENETDAAETFFVRYNRRLSEIGFRMVYYTYGTHCPDDNNYDYFFTIIPDVKYNDAKALLHTAGIELVG